ncbi:MAG: aminoacylase [Acidimicrobiales bacterium]|nr:aminoacylase [Acidimicrobiales bacterium]
MYDILIKGATVVDGLGSPPIRSDVGIKDGRIVFVGKAEESGRRVVDGTGKHLMPGFIDIHTHYDAQIAWDPYCTPANWHGVTTVVAGNCGFTLAPTRRSHHDNLISLLCRTEGMPREALEHGIPWEWETFPEYMDWLDHQRLGINFATNIGHSAVRYFVLGDEACERQATDHEIRQMRALVDEGLDVGAVGFTTSFVLTQNDLQGRPVPSRLASVDETLELASALRGRSAGVVGVNLASIPQGIDAAERQLLRDLAAVSGRPVNWNVLIQWDSAPGVEDELLAFGHEAAAGGAQIWAVGSCLPFEMQFSLRSTSLLDPFPTWKQLIALPEPEKLAAMQDPEWRRRLTEDMDGRITSYFHCRWEDTFVVSAQAESQKRWEGSSVAEVAQQMGTDPIGAMLDVAVADGLNTQFLMARLANVKPGAVEKIINDPNVIVGTSDGGAHLDAMSDPHFTTSLLARWVRDEGAMSLAAAVRALTFVPAQLYGLWDRGRIQVGAAADLILLDLESLGWGALETLHDLPANAPRYVRRARGYELVLVNGRPALEEGVETEEFSGQLIRGA